LEDFAHKPEEKKVATSIPTKKGLLKKSELLATH
jgi:hypothetical protein